MPTINVPKDVEQIIKIHAEEEHLGEEESAEALLREGVEEYTLHLIANGRISLTKATEALGTSPQHLIEEAEKYNIPLGPSAESYQQGKTQLNQLE